MSVYGPLDIFAWRRASRGLTATAWVENGGLGKAITVLERSWGLFQLVTVVPTPVPEAGFVERISTLDRAPEAPLLAPEDPWNMFLWSVQLSPWAENLIGDFTIRDRATQVLSMNGAINIQYQHMAGDRRYPTRFGCVNRLVSAASGEVREHVEYTKIFRELLSEVSRSSAES